MNNYVLFLAYIYKCDDYIIENIYHIFPLNHIDLMRINIKWHIYGAQKYYDLPEEFKNFFV